MNKTLGIVLGIIGATLLGAVVATISTVYYFQSVQKNSVGTLQQANTQNQQPPVVEQVPEQVPAQTGTPDVQAPIQDPGVVWLPTPQRISQDLKLFRVPDSAYDGDTAIPPGTVRPRKEVLTEGIEYYKTGTDNGNDIIMATIPPEGPGSEYRAYVRKTSAGSYEYILQNSDNYDSETKQFYGSQPIDAVRVNLQTLYASIQTQKTLGYKNVILESVGNVGVFTLPKESTDKRVRVAQTPYGLLYSQTQPGEVKELTVQSFILVKPNGLEEAYQYTPQGLLHDNGVADVVWSDGKKNTDTFMVVNTSGCGGGPSLPLLSESAISSLVATGKTSKGGVVYGFSNPNNPIIQFLYKATGGTYYGGDGESHTISLKEFQDVHPVLIVKDELDRYVVYNNSTWGPAVECGKPVIYLYPEHPSTVSVSVDADITKSDPVYGNGWNVRALPDGTILNGAAKYDSLFWEGTGHGSYPPIHRGFIVAKKDVEKTLRSHLTQLGLNKKESQDFLAFWLPRMPDTPFVRLSWLTTRDMNELAPLTIAPAPDTLMRIFLDFEGLVEPTNLPLQILPSPLNRKGFTVVEWGGLLQR